MSQLGHVKMLLIGLSILNAGIISGQDYPNKPIRIVTGSAGGGTDFTARLATQGFTERLGQPIIIDNRPGTVLGEILAKAPSDGYTLVIQGGSLWIGPLVQKFPYDVLRDFSPISQLVREVNVMVVNPSVPVKTVKELIALTKSRPGELNYSYATVAAPAQIGFELLKSMAGVNIVGVAYKGGGPATTGVISGEVQMSIIDAGGAEPHLKSGKLRALAITAAQPSLLFPELPTVAASGVPGFEMTTMTGFFAPARTPAAVITRLNQEIVRSLSAPEVKAKFLNARVEIVGSSPEQFGAIIKSDISKVTRMIKDGAIKPID